MKTLVISAGEASGDMYAAALVPFIKEKQPNITIYAIGGPKLAEMGVVILDDLTHFSTIGLLEPLRHIVKFLFSFYLIKRKILALKPDAVLAVDFQGFNVPLIKWAKSRSIRTAYFICPQEWQWGSERKGKQIAESLDLMLTIFPEAQKFYSKFNSNVYYSGHPLIQICEDSSKDSLASQIKDTKDSSILAVFTGSRQQEINALTGLFCNVASSLQKKYPNLRIVFSVQNANQKTKLIQHIPKGLNHEFYTGNSHALIKDATVSLTVSGTITLEHALLGTPFVTAYKFNPLSFWLLKKLLAKTFYSRIRYISLPNILMKESITPEFMQDQASKHSLTKAVEQILHDKHLQNQIQLNFKSLKKKLLPSKGLEKAGHIIGEWI